MSSSISCASMRLSTTNGIFGNSYVARFAGFEFAPGFEPTAGAVGYSYQSRLRRLIVAEYPAREVLPHLLLDLLQDPDGMIAGNERDTFVGAQFIQ